MGGSGTLTSSKAMTTTGPRADPPGSRPAARSAAARRDTPNEKPVAGAQCR